MNPIERQTVPCPDCKGTGEVVLGEEGRLYPCCLCWGRKTVAESHEAYETRLIEEIERLKFLLLETFEREKENE